MRLGHRRGGEQAVRALGWCRKLGIRYVSLYTVSAYNIAKRDPSEISAIMDVVEWLVAEHLAARDCRFHVAGRLELLRPRTAEILRHAVEESAGFEASIDVILVIAYDGRLELRDATAAYLRAEAAAGYDIYHASASLSQERISANLYNPQIPFPDLVVRTSGERRLSGFMTWQTVDSYLYFCPVLWPDFSRRDLLGALRYYARFRSRAVDDSVPPARATHRYRRYRSAANPVSPTTHSTHPPNQ